MSAPNPYLSPTVAPPAVPGGGIYGYPPRMPLFSILVFIFEIFFSLLSASIVAFNMYRYLSHAVELGAFALWVPSLTIFAGCGAAFGIFGVSLLLAKRPLGFWLCCAAGAFTVISILLNLWMILDGTVAESYADGAQTPLFVGQMVNVFVRVAWLAMFGFAVHLAKRFIDSLPAGAPSAPSGYGAYAPIGGYQQPYPQAGYGMPPGYPQQGMPGAAYPQGMSYPQQYMPGQVPPGMPQQQMPSGTFPPQMPPQATPNFGSPPAPGSPPGQLPQGPPRQ